MSASTEFPRITILGVTVHRITFETALTAIVDYAGTTRTQVVVTPYSESLVAAQADEEFRAVLNRADLSLADGISLKIAATYQTIGHGSVMRALVNGLKCGWWTVTDQEKLTGLPERITGVDMVEALIEVAANRGLQVFLLGGHDQSAARLVQQYRDCYPGLEIDGFQGPTDISRITSEQNQHALDRVNTCKPDILLVAFGPVKQEKWIEKNRGRLDVGVAMGVGGAFDFLVGDVGRAPVRVREWGLEWLYRLISQPARFKRQLAVPRFAWLVFRDTIH